MGSHAVSRLSRPEPQRITGTRAGSLAHQLDAAYQRTAANFPTNAAVRIEPVKGRDTLTLTGLDKLDEPPSLLKLRDAVFARLPRVDLPEVLLEIHARTGFAHEFTHLSEGEARAADLPVSLCAVLLAEACNIGLEPVVRSDSRRTDTGATQLGAAKLYPGRYPDPGECQARRYPVHHRLGPGMGRR